jgi:hypothetical protein
MNEYQKVGVLIVRLAGAIVAVFGLVGPLYAILARAIGHHVPDYSADRWIGSITWAVGGIVLMLVSKPLGRLFGRGLD